MHTQEYWSFVNGLSRHPIGSKLKFDPADVAAFIASRRTPSSLPDLLSTTVPFETYPDKLAPENQDRAKSLSVHGAASCSY